jgi:ABC-2 type transport system ATP-binding protein
MIRDREAHEPERSVPSVPFSVEAGLVVRGVRKRFRQAEVLRGVDLDVARGEVVALMGPNGAGKSTLLRIIAGTITPDEGHIVIDDHDARHDPVAARAAVSWVLGDEHGWYWRLTGYDNLVFFAMLRGMTRVHARVRAVEELERQRLQAAADKRVAEYSTGMRARLALARACMAPSAVMVLDEPGRGLDAAASEWLIELLAGLTNTAVVLVTHDMDMVVRAAQRSVLLTEGVVGQELPSSTPASTLAAKVAEAGLR